VADRKSFLLRIDRATLDAVQRWADDELRSLNGQIEFLLRRALRDSGRGAEEGDTVKGQGTRADGVKGHGTGSDDVKGQGTGSGDVKGQGKREKGKSGKGEGM
jgi:hypothetical protein